MTDASSSPVAPEIPADTPRGYDLSSRERWVGRPIPTLDIVGERFARRIENGLFGILSRHVEVRPADMHIQRHALQMAALAGANLSLVSLAPLVGNGLVSVDADLFHGMVDVMYGGTGTDLPVATVPAVPRDLSPTELRILERLVRLVCADYQQAWSGIHPVEPQFLRTERLSQFAAIAGPDEVIVTASFDVRVGEVQGQIHIGVPYTALEPLHDILYASPLGETESVDDTKRRLLVQELQSADLQLVAELATATLTIEQLLTMQTGDFIELDRLPTVMASIEGVPLFECQYGTHQSHYASVSYTHLTLPTKA